MTEKINETTLQKMFPHIAGYKEIREEAAQIVDLFQNEKLYLERGLIIQKDGSSMENQALGNLVW